MMLFFRLLACVAVLGPRDALAHTIIPGVSGFEGGLLHPVLVPSHAMSIVALALLLAPRPSGERHAVIATFAAALLGAVALVTLAFQTDRAEMTLLACAAVAGLLVAARAQLPIFAAMLLAAINGFALQFDSVPAVISISETLLTLAGAALAALIGVAGVAALAARASLTWQVVAIRILGSWIAATAFLLLALRFR
jgi:urease accessory protein